MSKPSDDTATLARTRVDGAWLYTDPETQSFCLAARFAGFDLADFDDWLSALAPCPAKVELTQRRARTIDLFGTDQSDAVRANIELILLRRREIMREEFVLPLAKQGVKQSQSQSKRAQGRHKITSEQEDRIRRQYAKKVASGDKYGALKELARIHDVSESTIKNVIKNSI